MPAGSSSPSSPLSPPPLVPKSSPSPITPTPPARWLAERGYTALVLLYRWLLARKRKSTDASAIELHDVSFRLHKGEILGIAGLVGAGRTEMARAIFGADAFDIDELEVQTFGQ